jgi:hypothetical protein
MAVRIKIRTAMDTCEENLSETALNSVEKFLCKPNPSHPEIIAMLRNGFDSI